MDNFNWKDFEGTEFNEEYRLEALLGFGTFGGVFRAEQIFDGKHLRDVAIKIPDPRKGTSLTKEITVAINLDHPHIIRCYCKTDGVLDGKALTALVMELGQANLKSRMEKGKFSVEKTREVAIAVASALVYLHKNNIIHRDIKPANIVLVQDICKVADVGVARVLNDGTDLTVSVTGSYAYMPPESYLSDFSKIDKNVISTAFDQWSLGIMIFEMLTGRHPFKTLCEVPSEEPNLSELPKPFKEIVKGCLQKDYKNRWTAIQVFNALEPATPTKVPRLAVNPISAQILKVLIPKSLSGLGVRILIALFVYFWFFFNIFVPFQNRKFTEFKNYEQSAISKVKSKDYAGAIRDSTEAIRLRFNLLGSNSINDYMFYQRGLAKQALGDKQGAIADFNQAITLNDTDIKRGINAYLPRGEAKQALGDKEGAIADYYKASETADSPSFLCNIGEAKASLGDRKGAINDYKKAAELYKKDNYYGIDINCLELIKRFGG